MKCVIASFAVALSMALPARPASAQAAADGKAQFDQGQYPATPDVAWDAIFTRTSGWTGADVAGTVDLGDRRLLWLFGDTWIGDVADGRHVSASRMINNSVAIQTLTGKPSQLLASSSIRFYWQEDSKRPTAWIIPNSGATAAGEGQSDSKTSRGWYWPTGGGAVVPGPGGRPRLLVFLFRVGKQDNRTGVWAFKSLGGTMATVDNVADRIEKWEIRQSDIPFAVGSDAAAKDPRRREISWGVAACRDSSANGWATEWLYIYGIRNESPFNRQVILARAKIESPSRFDEWQFYAGREKWSSAMADLVPIAEHAANELSIERLPGRGQSVWIMVHSEPALGRRIWVRTATRPEGPWTDPKAVYSVPDVDRSPAYFAYAAKGHLELSRRDELLITYVVDARDLGTMAKDAGIYRPRFIRVPLKAFLPLDGGAR
jgi:hypothetical protein